MTRKPFCEERAPAPVDKSRRPWPGIVTMRGTILTLIPLILHRDDAQSGFEET
jgi:hypothetical protein